MSEKMTKCKSCGNDLATSAKACPNCGAKNKKPIFKKWWFWVIIVVLLIGIIGSTGDSEKETTEENTIKATEAMVETEDDVVIYSEEKTAALTDIHTDKIEQTEEKSTFDSSESMGQKNARKKAESYLRYSSFSKEGLIEQLEYEGFTKDEATYAVNNIDVDWNEQALNKAESYLDYSAFSYEGLIDQLEYEGFTDSEAKYGADNCGADWNEQAAKKAESYLEFSSFSRSELIDQLEYEGFTYEQAIYGVESVGY